MTRAKSELAHVQRRLQQAAEAGAGLKEAENRALSAENALEELRARLGEVHRLTAPQPLPTLGVRGQWCVLFTGAALLTLHEPHL